MEENKNKFKNDLSRFCGLFGLFWSTILPILGLPFFISGIVISYKIRNEKDGISNLIFNVISMFLVVLYTIISYI
jgi:hypothetical protein